jgi:hypothetical protein
MAETFHYLLTLDSSVLNRGRDARQFTVSAQAALVGQDPEEGQNPHARIDFHNEHRPNGAFAISQRIVESRKAVIFGLTRPGRTLETRRPNA